VGICIKPDLLAAFLHHHYKTLCRNNEEVQRAKSKARRIRRTQARDLPLRGLGFHGYQPPEGVNTPSTPRGHKQATRKSSPRINEKSQHFSLSLSTLMKPRNNRRFCNHSALLSRRAPHRWHPQEAVYKDLEDRDRGQLGRVLLPMDRGGADDTTVIIDLG